MYPNQKNNRLNTDEESIELTLTMNFEMKNEIEHPTYPWVICQAALVWRWATLTWLVMHNDMNELNEM